MIELYLLFILTLLIGISIGMYVMFSIIQEGVAKRFTKILKERTTRKD